MLSVLAFVAIVAMACLTTATVALFCSVMFRKTSSSLMTTYLVIVVLFTAPLAISYFAATFFPGTVGTQLVMQTGFTSPFAVTFNLPIDPMTSKSAPPYSNWWFFGSYLLWYAVFDGALLSTMAWLFNVRWRMER
jgi:hypothetical protein